MVSGSGDSHPKHLGLASLEHTETYRAGASSGLFQAQTNRGSSAAFRAVGRST